MSPRARARQERALARARLRTGGAYLTAHARLRAAELGFHETEVLACVALPETAYPAHPAYGPGRRVLQRDDCCCVIDASSNAIITVLLRTQADWEHGVHWRGKLPPEHRDQSPHSTGQRTEVRPLGVPNLFA